MDVFAQIAKSGIGGKKEVLVTPEPLKQAAPKVTLVEAQQKQNYQPLDRIDSADELTGALTEARLQFAPFLQCLAPEIESTRTKIPLQEFEWQKKGDFQTTQITLPHYGGPLGAAETCYQTTFQLPLLSKGKHAFIRIQGADYIARVFVNNQFVGMHEGFFATFSFEISDVVQEGINTLRIELSNDYVMIGNVTEESNGQRFFGDKIYAATGPGYDDPMLGWHHCPPGMGLFDSVTIEITNSIFVDNVFTRTLEKEVEVWVELHSCMHAYQTVSLNASLYGENCAETIFENQHIVPTTAKKIGLGDTFTEVQAARDNSLDAVLPLPCGKGRNLYKFSFPREDLKKWDLETPYLYQLQISVLNEEEDILDAFGHTFGVRTFSQDMESSPKGMFYLNEEPIRLRGANTMGFEQQDVMRDDMDQLIDDILLAKLCNMNFLRLTQRPVQKTIYEYCDRLGLMTQTDLPLFGCLRRHQFCEAVRQAEEMERHVRSHPCNIMLSYINEPFPNAFNLPSMNLEREELESFFAACDIVVRLNNPDRVIKHVDGDYDPPSASMPDNHCYPLWYNGHGIDIGRLHKGYWMPVMPDWYYGCGEFGTEGLEAFSTMQQYYPSDWLSSTEGDPSTWSPNQIVNAQTNDFYHFFFDEQDSIEDWIETSQIHQAFATQIMTEAFRRDDRMISFAIHLFIDAFPAGWMKTIMDCTRTPKMAYFAYRNALSPILLSLRTDHFSYTSGESIEIESWVCNDTSRHGAGYSISYSLYCDDELSHCTSQAVVITENKSTCIGNVSVTLPSDSNRYSATLRATLYQDEVALTENEISFSVFPTIELGPNIIVRTIGNITEEDLALAEEGNILFVDVPEEGTYTLCDSEISVQLSGMSPMNFASRKTNHPWVTSFEPNDFSYWYSKESDMISPLASCSFWSEEFRPVLGTRNLNAEGQWVPAMLLGEKSCGAGYIVLSQISYQQMIENPAGRLLLSEMEQSLTE